MYGKASAMKGKPGAMLGKKHKISTIDKMSLTRKKQWSDAEFRKVMIDKLAKGRGNSRPELKVKEILDNLGITYKREKLEKKYLYDFYIPIKNIYIEVNGDFWHANPNKYMADSELSFPGYGKIKAKHLWDKDKKKREYVEGLGAKYVCIWESELKDKDANILLTERLNHAGFSI
jgi:G:T-mismatch repair DNA endonuclease (very short patch repair protein)